MSKKIFLISQKMIKYKVNCILGFTGIQKMKQFLWKEIQPLRKLGFINELDLRKVPFATLKL